MQSGAFIQLVLTLLAICARMTALLPELQDALQISYAACHRVLQILNVCASMQFIEFSTHLPGSMISPRLSDQ